MSYFTFLLLFILPPLMILLFLIRRQGGLRQGSLGSGLDGARPDMVVLGLVLIAVLYTTPWDNYLVATRVWWYNPALVTGLTLGWVPLEEYTFFVLQTLLTSLFFIFLVQIWAHPPHIIDGTRAAEKPSWIEMMASRLQAPFVRWGIGGCLCFLWLGSIVVLWQGWRPGFYLALILAWVLVPIIGQLAFGGEIIARRWRLAIPAILVPTLYLGLADTIAIALQIWTISPAQSTGIMLAGRLPLEEFVFFLVTNTLVVFGIVLLLAQESYMRLAPRVQVLAERLGASRFSGTVSDSRPGIENGQTRIG
ncbi:MAG: lycopene cyclase domain-containing protein [Chloroflexi bacterium]|nr:lycopene cyclase domain-containing protein [Chloroflexota bacterium]